MMLTCQSCMRQHVRNHMANTARRSLFHGSAAVAITPSGEGRRNGNRDDLHEAQRFQGGKSSAAMKQSYPNAREQWLQSRGQTPAYKLATKHQGLPTPEAEAAREYAVNKHLEFLQDPVKLADDIRRTLREDNFQEAIHVVRAASKNIECVVSWNHLVDWCMSKGKVSRAVEVYNEMKKRAQRPDNHTYTILFRGFASYTHYPHTLETALSIYHSMLVETSLVKPNKIHTNAILKVCARAGNMDAMFGIAAKLPTRGFRAADHITFTTILNALHMYATSGSKVSSMSITEKSPIIKKMVIDGRRMWDDIIGRWRKADMIVDEVLVCAMGRLLLAGQSEKDWDDVFSLVQQTMNIPRPLARLGTSQRDLREPSEQTGSTSHSIGLDEPNSSNETEDGEGSGALINEFEPLDRSPFSSSDGTYVKPGSDSLSMVMEALQVSSMRGYAKHYWDIFTNYHGVRPDRENYAAVLRVLRMNRASTQAFEILEQMNPSMLEHRHFRIALSACARDKANPHVFATAGKMLHLMEKTLSEPDLGALESYINVAMAKSDNLERNHQNDPQFNEAKYEVKKRIERALNRLQAPIANIRSWVTYGTVEPGSNQDTIKAQTFIEAVPKKEEFYYKAIRLLTTIIGAHDKLLYSGLLTHEEKSYYNQEKAKLCRVVGYIQQREMGLKPHGWITRAVGEKTRAVREKAKMKRASPKEPYPPVAKHVDVYEPEKKIEVEEIDYSIREAEQDRIAAEKRRREMFE